MEDDLMQQLESVLSDEQSMNQIMKIAQALGNDNNNDENTQKNSSPQNQTTPQTPDLASLISSLTAGAANNPPPAPNADKDAASDAPFDIGKLMQFSSMISQASKSDKNTELLLALKPHLKEEKQEKIDKVIKIFKIVALWPALKDSGLLGGDLFGIL